LQVSKAAVSQHIAELERVAGVSLVRRTTRSVQLTDAGRQLVEAAEPAFAQIAHGFDDVRDLGGVPRGLLRVTAPVAFARQQLVARLPAFLQANPLLRLELDMSDRLVSLAQEGFDLAIRHSNSIPDTHVSSKIADTQQILVASRAYLARRGTPRTPDDLSGHDCLHYPRPRESLAWHLVPAGKQRSPATSIGVRGPFAANNSEALRDAAIGGIGIALLPDFSADAALRAKLLVRVLPAWRPVGTFAACIFAVRPFSVRPSRAVRAFVEFLRASFAQGFLGERSART
jgi:DNA-binding transcriptional LysR family regulator